MNTSTAPNAASRPSVRYGWYVVLVLMICYALSFVDRQILSLLVGPIKHDLRLSDTRVALLVGLAFVGFYTLVGIPLGRLVDLRNRRNMIVFAILGWSIMTALTALATSFGGLFAARIGVGIGEAVLSPAAFSIISDCFERSRLSRPLSVYTMGIFVGSGIAMIVGGSVVQAMSHVATVNVPLLGVMASWRVTFLLVGAPGVLVALWVYSLREPPRQQLLRDQRGLARRLPVSEVAGLLKQRWQSFLGLSLGMIFQSMVTYTFTAWGPEFFRRLHHWNPQQTGHALGIEILTFGCLGMIGGGTLTDHWRRRGQSDAALKVLMLSAVGVGITFVPAFLSRSPTLTLWLIAPALFFEGMPIGSAFASLQLIFPNQARGAVSACFLFLLNFGGQTLGPLLPALLNNYVFRSELELGRSLAISMAVAAVGMFIIFGLTRRHYRRDYDALEQATGAIDVAQP